ncbi:hypothetical protein QBC40DRAFT_301875 [Triangularia verruculosa]|uniref:Secreted protein n=1 Tax=Triangularia verruculosa TaxID=2587418 RepID=A0AAN6X5X0_9PEZI|nr:hypothetical protein QBC40DRAFT_301875 [Triangularia verruculosa]
MRGVGILPWVFVAFFTRLGWSAGTFCKQLPTSQYSAATGRFNSLSIEGVRWADGSSSPTPAHCCPSSRRCGQQPGRGGLRSISPLVRLPGRITHRMSLSGQAQLSKTAFSGTHQEQDRVWK